MPRSLSLMLLALLISATLLTTACSSGTESVAQAAPPAVEKTVPVEVAVVKTGQMTSLLAYAGTLEAHDSLNILPKVSGRIHQILVEEGEQVQAGQPLATIEDETYQAQFQQAEAALTTAKLNLSKMEAGSRLEEIVAAQAAVNEARAQLTDIAKIDDNERTSAASALAQAQTALKSAQTEYDKIAWAGDVGATSQAKALEQATIAYQTALANYTKATNPGDATLAPLRSQLAQTELKLALVKEPFRPVDFELARTAIKQAEAALKLVRIQLDEATLKAPFTGTVAELYISPGSMVGPSSPVALFVSKDLEVVINIEENRLSQVAKGQHAALNVSAYPGLDFPAVVISVATVADDQTHTFVVKVTPQDKKVLLRSGMYADVTLLLDERQNTLVIPLSAIATLNNQPSVYVVRTDSVVEQRTVTTGLTDDSQVEILSGLKAGEKVVVNGQINLQDGVKVEVVPEL